jgi:hypothetical protein
MRRIFHPILVLVLSQTCVAALHACGPCSKAQVANERCVTLDKVNYPLCSTEKINHQNCVVVIDRRYPVTWPTIQMKPGKRVGVLVENPLDFETLSLDESSFSLLPGTDQLASLVPNLIPQLKGLGGTSVSIPPQEEAIAPPPPQPGVQKSEAEKAADRERDLMDLIRKQEEVMRSLLTAARSGIPDENSALFSDVRAVYEQLNQAMSPLPKPGSRDGTNYKPPTHAPKTTPDPWTDYPSWRFFLLCELVGGSVNKTSGSEVKTPCPDKDNPDSLPPFINVLGKISGLQAQLPSGSPTSQPPNALFDQSTFDGLAKTITSEIPKLTDESDRSKVVSQLNSFQQSETELMARLSVLSSTLGNIQKDFLLYYQNILIAIDALPTPRSGDKGNFSLVGIIYDPSGPNGRSASPYSGFLGRQVVYAVNAVNNVATSKASIVGSSNKNSLSSVTILYADPIFETSAGAMVSFVHNRTFANQTISNASAGSPFANGDIIITQTKTDPELVPFVAGHWRLGNEFTMPGGRRGAVYGTIWGGLNPYVTVPDYGAGPTISWRSFMVSFLYSRAHQTSLIGGEYQNEPVCGPTPMGSSTTLPACSGTPPAPVTKTTPLNAFAIGISVRVPTSFATGGGVSR